LIQKCSIHNNPPKCLTPTLIEATVQKELSTIDKPVNYDKLLDNKLEHIFDQKKNNNDPTETKAYQNAKLIDSLFDLNNSTVTILA
jgi:hypothetical protein